MKLRQKTLLFVTPFIIIPIILVASVAFYKLKQATEAQLNTQLVTLLDQISNYVYNQVSVAEANLLLLSHHHLVNSYALTGDESIRYELILPGLLRVFKDIQNSIPDYYEIRFILPDGFEDVRWAADGIPNISESVSNKAFYRELQNFDQDVFRKLIFDENTQQYAFLLVHKLILNDPAVDSYGAAPKLRGYIAINVSTEHLRNETNKNIIGKSGFLSVVDREGQLVVSPGVEAGAVTSKILNQKTGGLLNRHSEQSAPFEMIVDNSSFLLHTKKLPADLMLLGVLTEEEVLASSRELGIFTIIVTVITIIISMASVFFALRLIILRPIAVLNDAANLIGDGKMDFDLDLESKSRDEIGELARSFNNMHHQLQEKEKELIVTQGHVHHANKMVALGEMASSLAHEINSPIQAINLIAERVHRKLKKNKSVEDMDMSMTKIIGNVSKVSEIIDSLKNVSRGSFNDEFLDTRLHDLVGDVVNITEERLKVNNVHFDINYHDISENSEIQCQRLQISQVLINLVNNAYDAIQDQQDKWVKVDIRKIADKVRFSVTDSGAGIPADIAGRLFEPMFTTKDIGKGTGLGLSISNEIVLKHNGVMYIDKDTENTRFVFELPVQHQVTGTSGIKA